MIITTVIYVAGRERTQYEFVADVNNNGDDFLPPTYRSGFQLQWHTGGNGPQPRLGYDVAADSMSGDSADGNGGQHAVVLRSRSSTHALHSDVLLPHSTRRRRHLRAVRQRLQGLDQSADEVRASARVQRRL